ncbi:hypothetical protein ABPG72_015976 [Tetrahymena utriculariae]
MSHSQTSEQQEKQTIQSNQKGKKVIKIITNKIELQNQSQKCNQNPLQFKSQRMSNSAIDSQQFFLQQGMKRNFSQKSMQTSILCSQGNSYQQSSHNSTQRGSYNFKTQSKNCLDIMKEALEKRQQLLEKNTPHYAEAKKDVDQILNSDQNINKYFKLKKLSQVINLKNYQQFQQNQAESQLSDQNCIVNQVPLKRNFSEKFLANQNNMIVKNQSTKNLIQSGQLDQQNQYTSLNQQRSMQRMSQITNNQGINSSRSFLDESAKNHIQNEDSKIDHSYTSQAFNNSELLKKIKNIHKYGLNFDKTSIKKQYFTLKQNIQNINQKNKLNFAKLQRHSTNSVFHQKNKSEDSEQNHKQILNKKKLEKEDEYYGPWDIQQPDGNGFASFNCLTDDCKQ